MFKRLFEAQLASNPDNPKLLLAVASYADRRGDYKRCSILLGRAIKLGVKTFKVYALRGNALLKLAEAGSRQRPLLSMSQFVESAICFDRAISLGALSGQADLPLLVNAARCYFRAGSYEQAVRLLSFLVDKLPAASAELSFQITEVALQASQSLYMLNNIEEAVNYMRFVFNQVTQVHTVPGGLTFDPANDGDDTDDTDSDDDNDVMSLHHGVTSERCNALILGILVKQQIEAPVTSLDEENTKNAKNASTQNNETNLDDAAVQYSFFRHRAAAFAVNKGNNKRNHHGMQQHRTTTTTTTATTTTNNNNNDLDQMNAHTWSHDPYPWIFAGDTCLRRGQPVYASLCFKDAAERAQQVCFSLYFYV